MLTNGIRNLGFVFLCFLFHVEFSEFLTYRIIHWPPPAGIPQFPLVFLRTNSTSHLQLCFFGMFVSLMGRTYFVSCFLTNLVTHKTTTLGFPSFGTHFLPLVSLTKLSPMFFCKRRSFHSTMSLAYFSLGFLGANSTLSTI